MGMLRSRFQSLPDAFNVCLIPPSLKKEYKKNVGSFFRKKFHKVSSFVLYDKNVVLFIPVLKIKVLFFFTSKNINNGTS